MHILHCGVATAVGVQLGFAGAFVADAIGANHTYDTLAAHHVVVKAQTVACYRVGGRYSSGPLCNVSYNYHGEDFSAVIGYRQQRAFYIDPLNTSFRMSQATFANGPREVTSDIVFAALLVSGATLMTSVHQIHLRRRRRSRNAGRARAATPT
jgi:hypothetical protein